MPLILEERERAAYIAGNTELAAALAHAVDGDDELQADKQMLEEQNSDLCREVNSLEEQVAALQETVDAFHAWLADVPNP